MSSIFRFVDGDLCDFWDINRRSEAAGLSSGPSCHLLQTHKLHLPHTQSQLQRYIYPDIWTFIYCATMILHFLSSQLHRNSTGFEVVAVFRNKKRVFAAEAGVCILNHTHHSTLTPSPAPTPTPINIAIVRLSKHTHYTQLQLSDTHKLYMC